MRWDLGVVGLVRGDYFVVWRGKVSSGQQLTELVLD